MSGQAAEAALDSFLTHVALTLGDVLLLKHVMTKLSNLWSRDFNVSLFVEGHAHLDGSHVKHVIGAHHSINDYPEGMVVAMVTPQSSAYPVVAMNPQTTLSMPLPLSPAA